MKGPILLALCLASPLAAQHAVLVVAPVPGPGVDFTSIQEAVDAAAPADTILVRAGAYAPFMISGKSLAVTAEAGSTVLIDGFVVVQDLAAGGLVTLSGLTVQADGPLVPALAAAGNAGSVWLQDCVLKGFSQPALLGFEAGSSAVSAVDCDSLVITRGALSGGSAMGGSPAIESSGSNVRLYDVVVKGGAGQCETVGTVHCADGAAAVVLTGGMLSTQGGSLTGGAASPGELVCGVPVFGCLCAQFGAGAPALALLNGSPLAFLHDTALVPGPGSAPCGLPATDPVNLVTGQLVQSAGATVRVDGDTPVSVGAGAALDVSGAPGDTAILVLAIAPADVWAPAWKGAWLAGGSFQILVLGVLPTAGALSLPYVVPPLPPGFQSVEFTAQAASATTNGPLLGNPQRVVLLAAGL